MGILRFRVGAREKIIFGRAFVEFTRGTISTKNLDVTYSNGTGQQIFVNEVLYTYLSPGVDGYIQIRSLTNQILSGSGILNLSMTHKVSSTQSNQDVTFNYDTSPILVSINYNSKPVAEDITIDIDNRDVYTFLKTDFTTHYTDFDMDTLDSISIYGDVTGFKIDLSDYVAGDWIDIADIEAGLLTYVALDQDPEYETDNTWEAKDSNGNTSN